MSIKWNYRVTWKKGNNFCYKKQKHIKKEHIWTNSLKKYYSTKMMKAKLKNFMKQEQKNWYNHADQNQPQITVVMNW